MFARYVYCLTLSLVLLAYFRIMAEGEVGSEILSLLTLMAGVGGHQIARYAYNTAFRVFDYFRPLE